MTERTEERADSPQRLVSLETLKYFWDLVSRTYPELFIDLSLFNYKTGQFNKPEVGKGYAVVKKVHVTEAYENVVSLLEEYHAGKDILWKPSDYYKEHKKALLTIVWLDDFDLDNRYGIIPLFYLQTSPEIKDKPAKYQAFFKLKTPATPEEITDIQRKLAWLVGDKGAVSFYQHRRMPGLGNGKYENDPPVILFLNDDNIPPLDIRDLEYLLREEGEGVTKTTITVRQEPQGQPEEEELPKRTGGFYIRPVVPANYKPVLIRPRSDFIKRRPDGTIDESATDMAWALHIVRMTYNAGWDEAAIAFTAYELLLRHSPEVERRKKTPHHLRDYLYRTIWKAIKMVKETPSELRTEEGTTETPEEPSDV
ncbi:MAG: hypothetical protein JHC26_08690 [Thermofilum sp.]|uniref:DNA-primase RepB domain-containing protein n=1 Tax=Thermofilum sp. TaxID=1961369 RepID=UPI002585C9DC|nr:DNA-primase RepB domain-containing protein [Thermofilum sp.]MCI4409154.1 hypothetical protein [Thermofilum sp.]